MSAPEKDPNDTVYGLKAEAALREAGRADLVPHLAAWQEPMGESWKPTSAGRLVSDVRAEYDAGTVDLVHCRTPRGTALLAIRRKRRAERKLSERFSVLLDFAADSEKSKRYQARVRAGL